MAILYSGRDYLALPREPQPWLLKKIVPVSGLVNLYGPPKSRKSYMALEIASAISSGRLEWNNLPVLKHGKVVYIQADTPREEWAKRIEKMDRFGFPIDNIYFADILTLPNLQLNVLDPGQVEKLKAVINDVKPVLTVFDTLRESFQGDENSSDIMQAVIRNIVQTAYPSAIMLVSHKRKDNLMGDRNAEADLMDDGRGSSYISGRMDNIVRLTKHRLTVKGRSVRQTTWDVIEADEDFDEDDPNAPLPFIRFKDDGKDLLEAAFKQVLLEQPKISNNAAAILLVTKGASKLSAEHLRKEVLPGLRKRLQPALGIEGENLPQAA